MKSIHGSHRIRNQLALGVALSGYFGLLAVEIVTTGATALGPLGVFTLAMVVGGLTGVGLVVCRRGALSAHFGGARATDCLSDGNAESG